MTAKITHLLVEYAIPFVDICDITLFLVESLARELGLLVNAAGSKSGCVEVGTNETLTLG